MEKENKELKSSVFADLFQDCPEAKENALSLVNALEGTSYTNPNIIQHFRIEDTVYKDSINDVSFTIDNRMLVLMEHQSTINENMPLRCLIYVGRLNEKIIPAKSRYKRKTVRIPTPEFFVFYNGVEDYPSELVLRLSDAFQTQPESPVLEVIVHVININPDKKNDIWADYLRREAHDVETFLQSKYDYQLDMEVQKEEAEEAGYERGIKDGISKGVSQGRNESILRYIQKQRLKGIDDVSILEDIIDTFELPEAEAKSLITG